MTKGDKRNKREYERKLKSQGGAGLNHKADGENKFVFSAQVKDILKFTTKQNILWVTDFQEPPPKLDQHSQEEEAVE